jgi:nitrogenase molybdenum-cofactor synthesis protein NifE
VAHLVHGPIGCAGSSWDNRGSASSGPTLNRLGFTTDLNEQDVIMGRGERRLFPRRAPYRHPLSPGGGLYL